MLCPVCKTMAGIVEVTETEMVYNCRNPKCPMYGKEVARQPLTIDHIKTTTED